MEENRLINYAASLTSRRRGLQLRWDRIKEDRAKLQEEGRIRYRERGRIVGTVWMADVLQQNHQWTCPHLCYLGNQ